MKRLDWSFAHDYLKPRLKGNFILDMNPMSKANILIAMTLSAFVVFDVAYAFALTALILVFAALAHLMPMRQESAYSSLHCCSLCAPRSRTAQSSSSSWAAST